MKGKHRTPLPRSPTRKRKPGPKPVKRPKGEAERLARRRRDAMKYRLAGASYRVIAEKLTDDRASEYADANGITAWRRSRPAAQRAPTRRSESRTAGIPDTSFAFWRLSGIVRETGPTGATLRPAQTGSVRP